MTESPTTQMSPQEILMKLKQIAQEQLNLTPEQLTSIQPDAPVMEALRLDSLATVVLISSVEREFGLTFEPEHWQSLTSIKDLVLMIQNGLTERGVKEGLKA
jgi:acyl carrier protein